MCREICIDPVKLPVVPTHDFGRNRAHADGEHVFSTRQPLLPILGKLQKHGMRFQLGSQFLSPDFEIIRRQLESAHQFDPRYRIVEPQKDVSKLPLDRIDRVCR